MIIMPQSSNRPFKDQVFLSLQNPELVSLNVVEHQITHKTYMYRNTTVSLSSLK